MKAHGFRVCFTPLLEVLFTFPSRYLYTIGLSVVFSLAGWAPQIPAEFLVLRGTQVPACPTARVSRTGLSPSTDPVSTGFRYACRVGATPVLQPRALPKDSPGLGSCAFARHYLRNHSYFLFLRVLRCFSSPGSPATVAVAWWHLFHRVSPFGHPRVAGHLPLTAAFRSLSRPSSPPRATGIPHAPFLSFLVPSRKAGQARAPPCLVDLLCRYSSLDRSLNSISSLRFSRLTCSEKNKFLLFFTLRVPNMSMTSYHVEDNGLEPLTPCLQSRCSTS